MQPERPEINGQRKPLAVSDPIAWWADEARTLGIAIDALYESVTQADETIERLLFQTQLQPAPRG